MKIIYIPLALALSLTSCQGKKDKREIFDAQGQKAITSSVSRKNNTVSVLFGNQAALESAVKGGEHKAGEIFTLVTWAQEAKKFWYPGLINGKVKSREIVRMVVEAGSVKAQYRLIEGQVPGQTPDQDQDDQERIKYITSQRASIYP